MRAADLTTTGACGDNVRAITGCPVAGIDRDVVCLPFVWPLIDAYYLAPALGALRVADGLPDEPVELGRYLDAIGAALDRIGGDEAPAHICLIMHPFLYIDGPGPDALDGLLARLAELQRSGVAHVGPGRDAAARLREAGSLGAPVLAEASWA